jgi:tellurite methyltransferase
MGFRGGAVVEQAGEHWDRRYRDHGGPVEPSRLLVDHDDLLPCRGRAVDLAGGSGRNALWLAARGLDTTIIDVSPVALAIARQRAEAAGLEIETVCHDLERDGIPDGTWDLVVIANFWDVDVATSAIDRLGPGGYLVVCHPTTVNLERHVRPGRRHLAVPDEVTSLVAGRTDLEVAVSSEGWRDNYRHEAHLIVRRVAPA